MRDWKDQDVSEFPTINEFLEFLNNKTDPLEDINDQKSDCNKREFFHKNDASNNTSKSSRFPLQVHSTFNKGKCNFCQKDHLIYSCNEFLKLDKASRIAAVEKFSLCKNCLRVGHTVDTCSLGPCKKCNLKHNSLLHVDVNSSSTKPALENNQPKQSFLVNPSQKQKNYNQQVLLSTVTFLVRDANGQKVSCRALLDSGSQVHLLTEQFVKRLQLPLLSTRLTVSGINQTVSTITSKCLVNMFSKYNDFSTTITCYIVPTISNHTPMCHISIETYNIPNHIQLSDSEFHQPNQVDGIIGSMLFWDLITEGKMSLGKNLPTLQNSKLGWIIAGPTSTIPPVSCNFTQTIPEDYQLKKFWEVEELTSFLGLSQDDSDCETIFHATTFRNNEGRFVVYLPLKNSPTLLGDSLTSANKQFLSLERKFSKDQLLKTQYSVFIQEYLDLGHLSKIEFPILNAQWYYFLPHHGVFKEESLTTKLRVVFNGSNPTDSGWSLNDLQFSGPKIQNNIFPILLRFRTYTFVVSADITKMYRQILIHPNHRPLQLILWREHPDKNLETFQLNTVMYGTTSAPYLAIKCLKELSTTCSDQLVSNSITNDFYVDDLLTGHNDLQTIQNLCKSIYDHLASAGFILRKWISNYDEVLSKLDVIDDPLTILNLSNQDSSKTLGIKWFSKADQLKYSISEYHPSESISKRQILSEIAQIYDPLGLLSPSIILAKVIIQRLWSLKLSWDTPVPAEYSQQWLYFRNQLINLNQLEIARHAIGKNSSPIDLHFFSDASQQAYASCCYIRSQDVKNKITVKLLCSKTKIAPVKTLSISRLELCEALLSAQLSDQVVKALNLNIPYYFWTDSQVVLAWLKLEPNTLEVFVSNRVANIQNLTLPTQWYYVSTNQNPADIASRGTLPNYLLKCDLWWQGPAFLKMTDESEFAQLIKSENSIAIDIPEIKKHNQKLFLVKTQEYPTDVLTRFSNLTRLKRVMLYVQDSFRIYTFLFKREIQFQQLQIINLQDIG